MFLGIMLVAAILSLFFDNTTLAVSILAGIFVGLSVAYKFTVAKWIRKLIQYIPFAYLVASKNYTEAFVWFCIAVVIEIATVFIPTYREKEADKKYSKPFLLFGAVMTIIVVDLFQFFNVLSLGNLFKKEYQELGG